MLLKNNNKTDFYFSPSVLLLPMGMVLLMWLVFWVERKYNFDLLTYGIFPRTFDGIKGIVFSPFLHGSIEHLFNNSFPIAILLAALRFFYRNVCYRIVVFGILSSGFLTWNIGRESYHIGASGLVYVLASFVFFKGLQTKYYRLVALSFAVIMVYGGMIWFIFPDIEQGISWEAHLSGFIVGIVFSRIFAVPIFKQELKYDWQQPNYVSSDDKFMQRFDENGNFQNVPKVEETWEYFTSNLNVIYENRN